MLLLVIRVLFAVSSAGAIAALVSSDSPAPPPLIAAHPFVSFVVLMLITQSVTFIDILIPRKRIEMVSAIYFGLMIGFLLSYLTNLALGPVVSPEFRGVVLMTTNLILPYLC